MRTRHAPAGVTLIELMVLVLLALGAMVGVLAGIEAGRHHGGLWGAAGALIGGVGGCFSVVVALVVFLSFVSLISGLLRLAQPGERACTCGRADSAAVPNPAASPLADAGGFAAVEMMRREGLEGLREWVERGGFDPVRLSLSASLGHVHAAALSKGPPPEPPIRFSSMAKVPADLRRALRSGLPPRMIAAWALACGERALAVFESEFHQERRPREAWDAAVGTLSGTVGPLGARPRRFGEWREGCRVFRRTPWERFCGKRTPGERASDAVSWAVRCAEVLSEPSSLWTSYAQYSLEDGYASMESRCTSAQPCLAAEYASEAAALASADPQAEQEWQRALLADMVLGWEPWDGDREAWRRRIEDEWIPRIQAELRTTRFQIPVFVERVRRELAPWA